PDSAAHRMDQHPLPRGKPAARDQGVVGSVERLGDGRAFDVGKPGRKRRHPPLAPQHRPRLSAAADQTHHPVSRPPARHPRSQEVDVTRVLEAGDVGGPARGGGISPTTLVDISTVETRRQHPHPDLAWPRRRGRHFADGDHLRAAGAGVDDCTHHGVLMVMPRSLPCLLAATLACSDSTAPAPGNPLPPGNLPLPLAPVATGLDTPLDLTAPPGDARLFVVEKTGRIRLVKNGALLSTPFLDLHDRVSGGAEQGLLGLAFDPAYGSNGRFVVNYTNLNGDTRISAFRVSADPDVADPATETVLLAIPQPFSNHNGGQVVFGPDGYLYAGLGDGGGAGDPDGNGQSLATLLGKLLRIDLNGGTPYAVPPDNPFAATAGPATRGEIWSFGLRNPWRFSFDRATHDLYIADVGQDTHEEVDVAAAPGDGRGLNFGWNRMEGAHCYPPSASESCDRTGLTLP